MAKRKCKHGDCVRSTFLLLWINGLVPCAICMSELLYRLLRRCNMGSTLAGKQEGLITARQRQAEQQVARILARSGGKFTDSLEREAERAVLGR